MSNLHHTAFPGHAALRRGRCSMAGCAYLVTTVTASRRAWFADWPVARVVASELGGRRLWRDTHVHAWVLMPDHMHVLLTLGRTESLSHLMARVKAVTAGVARKTAPLALPVWAAAFHDHALRHDEAVRAAASYVIANPVRAGLAKDIGAWPFWSADWL